MTRADPSEGAAVETSAGLPLMRRIAATFIAPARLADSIRDRPRWLDVLLLSTLVAIAAAAMLPDEMFLEAVRDPVSRRGTPVEVTSPPGEVVRWGRYLAMMSALVGHPLLAFALAGVLTLAFTVVPRGSNRFLEHLALSSHALLIPALGSLIGLALGYATGGEPHVSLALLAPFLDDGSTARELLALISPFTLWMLVVLAIGVARLDPRRTVLASASLLVGGYLALALILAG